MNNKIPYTPPKYQKSAFNCPYCNAYARQDWHNLWNRNRGMLQITEICYCTHCSKYSIWHEEQMIYPDYSGAEPPNEDLEGAIRSDYEEAASILQKSPRGAAALLRLAIQKLCNQLGEKSDINVMIGNLVKKGLPVRVQQALDSVRVIGNEAVHPGELDLKDDIETADKLFKLINFIAEKMITEPKEVEKIFNTKVPETKKKAIEARDTK